MNFDAPYFGWQGVTRADLDYRGSRFSEVRDAVFANAYYRVWDPAKRVVWGPDREPPLPVYKVTLRHALRWALPFGKRWGFQEAANRSIDSRADLRWGAFRRGFRRILHPNAVCLTGTWEIDEGAAGTDYTGYFASGSRALIIGRYSTCCTETRRGRYRSPSLVGKLYPTMDMDHPSPLRTANFITQEDLGGTKREINEAELRNAPDITPWRRGLGLPVLLLTVLVLVRADKEPKIRQLHEIAELGKPPEVPTRAPQFMRLIVEPGQPSFSGEDLDFRDEVLGRIYDPGNPRPQRPLTFHIEVSDEGRKKGKLVERHIIRNWKRIGRIVFRDAVASYNGDFVIHFHHPVWRKDRNNPHSAARPPRCYTPAPAGPAPDVVLPAAGASHYR